MRIIILSLFIIFARGAFATHDPSLGKDAHIAEEDIDASSLDEKSTPKKLKKSTLDDIEFVSEADKINR